MVKLTMIALWIGAFASGLLGVVAVSNENVPVRRQRLSSPDSPDYEDALDEPDGDVVQSGALGESQGPGPGSCTPGRSGRNCRRSECSRIGSSPKSGNFAAGACGVDACPSGYNPITTDGECATAAAALGFTWYAGGYERSKTNGRANVCNFCGGCGGRDGKHDGGRTVRIDDNHFNVANFICKKACQWGETTSENDGSSVCKPWSDYANCKEEKRQGACTDGNEWVAKHCSKTCKASSTSWVMEGNGDSTSCSSGNCGANSGNFNCDKVCAAKGKTCDQAAIDSLTSTAAIHAAFASAGFTCNGAKNDMGCQTRYGGGHCASWGSPYLYNQGNYLSEGRCFFGDGNSHKHASCSQNHVDGNHRRLCPCK